MLISFHLINNLTTDSGSLVVDNVMLRNEIERLLALLANMTGSIDETLAGSTDPEADNYDPEATTDDGSCAYQQVTLGDVNGDGMISVTDITKLIDYILEEHDLTIQEIERGDLEVNNIISITDIILISNIISIFYPDFKLNFTKYKH